MPKEIVIFITAPSARTARAIGRRLVEERLAACANIVPGVESVFSWQGKIRRAREALMLVKTRDACFNRLVRRVRALHPYSVPEIIALSVVRGSQDYLRWIRETTR